MDEPRALPPPGDGAPWRARLLRAILAFAKTATEEQLRQLPLIGPALLGAGEALDVLADEVDDDRLEARVEEILSVGSQTSQQIQLLVGLAGLVFHRQEALLGYLQQAGLPAQPALLDGLAREAALAAYRGAVAAEYQYVDYRGIAGVTREEHAASLPLDAVYVVPRLVSQERGLAASGREEEERLLRELLHEEEPARHAQLEEQYAAATGAHWRPPKEEPGQPLGASLKEAGQLVVLGGPGTGKSTLVRFLARACALGGAGMEAALGWQEELLPVVLPLAAYALARSQEPALSLAAFLDGRMAERAGEALRAAVAGELAAGRVLLLLDGVDEVQEDRVNVAREVEGFIRDHAACRILVTSRPHGYIRLEGDIAHWTLPNFAPQEVEQFTHRWQRAFEQWRHPQAADLARAETEAAAMLAEIGRHPRVAELATNPLMLVIVSLIRYEQTRLPEQRVELYHRAVNTLMDSWNRVRSLARIDVGGAHLDLADMRGVWGAVAEWTRRTRPGTGLVQRAELERELVRILKERELDEGKPEATARSYLNAAADRAGLLEERGRDVFAFWHPTFEEFLAAVELSTPTGQAIGRLLPLRDDPRWREVILLAVGCIGRVQNDPGTATELAEALAFREAGALEPLFHDHLRLAAACTADAVGLRPSLVQRIIEGLARVVAAQPYGPFQESFVQTVRSQGRQRPDPSLVEGLRPLAQHPAWEVRMEAARLLSNVAAEQEAARALCQRLLQDGDADVRCHAALGLARAGDRGRGVWVALATYGSSFAHAESAVGEFLVGLGEEARRALVALLRAPDARVRLAAAAVLERLGRADAPVVEALVALLRDPDARVRRSAADVLVRLGRADAPVVEAVAKLVEAAPWEALAAWQRLQRGESLDEAAGWALAALVSVRPEDDAARRDARRLLFGWLWDGAGRAGDGAS